MTKIYLCKYHCVNTLEGCKQKLDVYLDLANTFYEISDKDYLEKLEQEERERKEREAKKRRKKL